MFGEARRCGGRIGWRLKRHLDLREMLGHQAQSKLTHDLKAGQTRAQVLVGQAQQLHRRFQRGHGGKGRKLRGGQGVELHDGAGNDAQRALRPDHQVAQVVAGVVLAQARQAVPDIALRRYHFQPQAQLARVAVAHDLRAASVGAQVAANGAAALGRHAQGEQKAGLLASLLQGLQHAAGVHRDGQVGAVDGAHLVHALQAQHDLRAAGVGRGAHHHAGVAALGHDADTGRGAGPDHGSHLGRIGRAHHGQRVAVLALAPVLLIGARGRRLGQYLVCCRRSGAVVQAGMCCWSYGGLVSVA